MNTSPARLQSARIRNFKAIIDSGMVKFGPLTAFVGNNGSGKSSLIEALEAWQHIVLYGLDAAMGRWLGIEHVRHKSLEAKERAGKAVNPIVFQADIGPAPRKATRLETEINNTPNGDRMGIVEERLTPPGGGKKFVGRPANPRLDSGRSYISLIPEDFAEPARALYHWQFLSLAPDHMGIPQPQQRTEGHVRLRRDGANIADYLLEIRSLSLEAFNGIVQAMAYVLPYARDLQPAVTSELERKAYLQLSEADFKLPGWMLSTGTLRVLALLAVLRHPNPPPLVVIEEIENGLDPRSLHLLVEEIRTAVLAGVTQVVITTHSPYLLDLLTLDQIVLVTRNEEGHARFDRPADSESLQRWAQEFAPGRLYTMGKLHEAIR